MTWTVGQALYKNWGFSSVASEAKITLFRRYVQKKKQRKEITVGYIKIYNVFTDKQEKELAKYILTA